ncbi:MAG: exodeoxyribonuclease III [Pseudomonadota bacterium]
MKIATWNVNSIKARMPSVSEWLESANPDVVLLQEIKSTADTFPYSQLSHLGYNIEVVGQKTYNGVAILSKRPIEDIITKLPGDSTDEQARYIEAVVGDVRVASVYVPNGQEVGSEKFAYKLAFYERLYRHVQTLLQYEEAFVIGGDYNVALNDEDVYDPKTLAGKLLFSLPERSCLRKILNLGLTDATRIIHPASSPQGQEMYSWWDYRAGSWANNNGMRIDYLLLSPQAADRLDDSQIDKLARGKTKASDHAPVWCSLR